MKRSATGGVVLGSDFMALGVVRSLAEHGVPTFVLSHEAGIARFSRYCDGSLIVKDLHQDRSFPEHLLAAAKTYGLEGWVPYPNCDITVELLARHRDALADVYRVGTPPWPVTRQFIDKCLCYDLAEANGIPIPLRYPTDSLEALLESDPAYPLVLKPTTKDRFYPHTKKKALRADSPEQVRDQYTFMRTMLEPSEIVAQELIEGGTKVLFSHVVFFDGERICVSMTGHRARQHPMDFGKATTYAVSTVIPELHEPTERLLKAMGYYGIAEVEFMFDERSGLYKFIEINGRPWGWHTLAKAAGANISYAYFCHLMEKELPDI